MKTAILLGLLLLWPTLAGATTYYFTNSNADCVTSGTGTTGQPLCMDNDYTVGVLDSSFIGLADANSTQAAAGDILYLCIGDCDGAGTGQFRLADELDYAAPSGSDGNLITLMAYPGETVALSGDTNNNCAYNAGTDQDEFIRLVGVDYWTVKDLIIEYYEAPEGTGDGTIRINESKGWVFDNITIRYNGSTMWANDATGGDSCAETPANVHCWESGGNDCINSDSIAMRFTDTDGPMTIKNSLFHHIDGFIFRMNNNPSGSTTNAGQLLWQDNEMYNSNGAWNFHNPGDSDSTITIQRDYCHDMASCVSIEQNVQNVVIEDMTVACLGEFQVTNDYKCGVAISINNGEGSDNCLTGVETPCRTRNVRVRRNLIYGTAAEDLPGFQWKGIEFTAQNNNAEDIDTIIENNIIYNVHKSSTCGSACPSDAVGTGISVNTDNAITVQNNTVSTTTCWGMCVTGAAHTVKNNYVEHNIDGTRFEIEFGSSVTESYNVAYASSGNVGKVGGTSYTCANWTAHGTGNDCAAGTFLSSDCEASPSTCFRLNASDTALIDSGTTGASDDIDGDTRSGSIDIGADEFVAGVGGGGGQSTLIQGRVVMSGRCVIQ